MSSLWNLLQSLWSLRSFSIAKEIVLSGYQPTQYDSLNHIATFIVVVVSTVLFVLYKRAIKSMKYDLFVGIAILSFAVFLTYQPWFWFALVGVTLIGGAKLKAAVT